jgi:hypothetical protein
MKKKIVKVRSHIIYYFLKILSLTRKNSLPIDEEAEFIVSIASYPKRDHLLPAVFEALSKQTVLPKKWVLVLSIEDYNNKLPKHLTKLQDLGLEIIWVKNNPFAVKKLLPTKEKYPDLSIITFDDELIYGRTVIQKLTKAARKNKNCIIGHVGKRLYQIDNEMSLYFRFKKDACYETKSNEIYFLGGSGTYYPPDCFDKKVFNIEAIHNIVPGRGSDMWFWAAAIAKGTTQVCLGSRTNMSLYFTIPLNKNTKPLDPINKKVLEDRFSKTIDYFGIREKLIETLTNKKD